MKAITSAQMRELEKVAVAEFDIPAFELMRRAGRGLASTVAYLADKAGMDEPFIEMIAGRGNNGGDVFAAALFLKEENYDVEVLLAGSASEIKGDALRHLGKMRAAGISLIELPTKESWMDALQDAGNGEIIVDGVLGIGIKGPPRGPAAAAIHYINTVSEDNLVVAVDIPSGLDADTGDAPGEAVLADVTATIGLPKIGLLAPKAVPYVGSLDVIGIGLPMDLANNYECSRDLITGWDIRRHMPRRPRAAHKGMYGHLLVIGGALGYAGAPAMAARAALRSGVGLTSVLIPAPIYPVVAGANLEAMTYPAESTSAGTLGADAWATWGPRINDFDAIVAGPGLTRHADSIQWVHHLLQDCRRPLVLDADALNVLADNPDRIARAQCPVILTPHPGELARLLGVSSDVIQNDREAAAREAARRTKAVVVLKGAGTIVATEKAPLSVNMTGNPGMATGGMGDVLAGLIGSFLAQGFPALEAACAGVFVHGRAGDNAMWRRSQTSLSPLDLIEEFPSIFREVAVR